MSEQSSAETKRLEQLWHGSFGDAYLQRNITAGEGRQPFWQKLLESHRVNNVLEVGCNVGGNLRWIRQYVQPRDVFGIDIGESALRELRTRMPDVNPLWSPARELPFRDRMFDLVFTAGVLIHQPESTLPLVMAEIVRCSRKYVLALEYFSDLTVEVPYREVKGALFKRNYGGIYQELFPELKLVEKGFLGKEEGWDDVTYWLFEKPV